jgi:hypothetical protein
MAPTVNLLEQGTRGLNRHKFNVVTADHLSPCDPNSMKLLKAAAMMLLMTVVSLAIINRVQFLRNLAFPPTA